MNKLLSPSSLLLIRRLETLDPALLEPLVVESERFGYRFVRRLAEDYAAGVNRFDAPGEALFGAFDTSTGALIGIGGLNRDPFLPVEAQAGRVRRLYIAASCRGRGVGRQLVDTVAETAQRYGFALLTLRTDHADAAAFYRALGFTEDSTQEGATHWKHLTPTAEADHAP